MLCLQRARKSLAAATAAPAAASPTTTAILHDGSVLVHARLARALVGVQRLCLGPIGRLESGVCGVVAGRLGGAEVACCNATTVAVHVTVVLLISN